LQHEAGKHAEDLQPDAVAELVDRFQQLGGFERVVVVGGAQPGLLILVPATSAVIE